MRLFDPRAALAEIEKQPLTPATPATSATQPPKTAPNVASVAKVAGPTPQIPQAKKPDTMAGENAPKWFSAGGRPRTWTGKVVSLAEWRGLTEYERNGPSVGNKQQKAKS